MSQDRITLLQQARQGDGEASASLVAPALGRLLAFVRRAGAAVASGDGDEEDLLQTTLGRAWRLLPRYVDRGPESFYRWLATIARHTVGDRRKYVLARRRLQRRSAANSAADSAIAHVCDPATSIPRAAIRREECARILAALAEVPVEQRSVVEMHLLEARSLGEIARALGLAKNAVWERLHRGLAQVRERLELSDVGS